MSGSHNTYCNIWSLYHAIWNWVGLFQIEHDLWPLRIPGHANDVDMALSNFAVMHIHVGLCFLFQCPHFTLQHEAKCGSQDRKRSHIYMLCFWFGTGSEIRRYSIHNSLGRHCHIHMHTFRRTFTQTCTPDQGKLTKNMTPLNDSACTCALKLAVHLHLMANYK